MTQTPVRPPVATGKWRTRDLWHGIGLLLVGYVAVVALAIILGAVMDGPTAQAAEADDLASNVIGLGFTIWLGAIVFILATRRDLTLGQLGFREPASHPVRWVAVALFGGWGVVIAWGLVVSLIEQATGADLSELTEGNLPVRPSDPAVLVVLGISTVVAAPLAEELYFRAFLFRAIQHRWGLLAGLVGSGFVFGAIHLVPSVIVPFWGIGILFAWTYHRSGSLWTPIVAHAIFNGTAFIVMVTGALEEMS